MSDTQDLWPDNLVSEIPRTPTHILREQAAVLGKKTNNIVQAKVRTRSDRDEGFLVSFILHSPALQGYEYELFEIWHDEGLYPVTHEGDRLDDEKKFISYLKSLFSSQRTVNIIRGIIAQARVQSGEVEDDDVPF